MRPVFLSMMSLFLILALSLSGCVMVHPQTQAYRSMVQLDRESEAYINRILPPIIQSWNAQALIKEANPTLLETTSPQQIKDLFQHYQKTLGAFQDYNPATGNATAKNTPRPHIYAKYKALAYYEKGSAEFRVLVVKTQNRWQIQHFEVNPDPQF